MMVSGTSSPRTRGAKVPSPHVRPSARKLVSICGHLISNYYRWRCPVRWNLSVALPRFLMNLIISYSHHHQRSEIEPGRVISARMRAGSNCETIVKSLPLNAPTRSPRLVFPRRGCGATLPTYASVESQIAIIHCDARREEVDRQHCGKLDCMRLLILHQKIAGEGR